jgi:hypothetical protein
MSGLVASSGRPSVVAPYPVNNSTILVSSSSASEAFSTPSKTMDAECTHVDGNLSKQYKRSVAWSA